MTSPEDPRREPGRASADVPEPHPLSPAEEEAVSRLLAESAGPLTPPPEVVARLEDALAALIAERAAAATEPEVRTGGPTLAPERAVAAAAAASAAEPDGPASEAAQPEGTVTALASRRRRTWSRGLLAAAAVMVGGYAVGATVPGLVSGGGGDAGSAGGEASSAADSAVEESAGGGASPEPAERLPESVTDGLGPVVLSGPAARVARETLAEDAARIERSFEVETRAGLEVPEAARRCAAPPRARAGRWFVVRLEGSPASLVIRRADGSRTAVLYDCATAERLADATLPPG